MKPPPPNPLHNPGKYDDLCTAAREAAGPHASAFLIILNGNEGPGFAVQVIDPALLLVIPAVLRSVADAIEKDPLNPAMPERPGCPSPH